MPPMTWEQLFTYIDPSLFYGLTGLAGLLIGCLLVYVFYSSM